MTVRCRKARPENIDDMEGFRLLVREYVESLGLDLAYQGLEEELASLPGKYSEPEGAMILAEADGILCGCVAMKKLEPEICEMKRLYVKDRYRGSGAGRLLVERILSEARERGYSLMRLDSLGRMRAAVELYRSFGFRPAPAYVFNPIEDAVFMEKDLGRQP